MKGFKMSLRAVNPPTSTLPGISQGVIAGDGRLLFLSGQVPIRADGTMVPPEFELQLEQVFRNLEETLRLAGATFKDVVRLTIYVRDYRPELLDVLRAVRNRFINPDCPPASTLVGVAALFHPNVLVEIDGIALLPSG
jgi:2-iminobutanoate/2-iminopropanoate deaminase